MALWVNTGAEFLRTRNCRLICSLFYPHPAYDHYVLTGGMTVDGLLLDFVFSLIQDTPKMTVKEGKGDKHKDSGNGRNQWRCTYFWKAGGVMADGQSGGNRDPCVCRKAWGHKEVCLPTTRTTLRVRGAGDTVHSGLGQSEGHCLKVWMFVFWRNGLKEAPGQETGATVKGGGGGQGKKEEGMRGSPAPSTLRAISRQER